MHGTTKIGSNITAFGTAFGEAADIGLCFVAYHMVLVLYLFFQPRWNAAALVALILFEVGWLTTVYLTIVCTLPSFYWVKPHSDKEV